MKAGQYSRRNLAARADPGWWQALLTSWSGTSVQQFLILCQPDFHLFSDVSGSWGCDASLSPDYLSSEGAFPHCLSYAVLGKDWAKQLVPCHSDNVAAVTHVNHLHVRDPIACHMLRFLAFFQALHECHLHAIHIPAADNSLADLLSCNNAPMFLLSLSYPGAT